MYRGEIQNDSNGGNYNRSLDYTPTSGGLGGGGRYETRNLAVGAGIGRCEEDAYNCCGLYGRGDDGNDSDSDLEGGAVPTNPALYEKAKAIVNKSYPKHSAYRSGAYVKKYKEMGGEYRDDGERKLKRWFEEDWEDVGNEDYPTYRPTKRITKDTPLTADEIDPQNLSEQVKEKQKIKGTKNLKPFVGKGKAFTKEQLTKIILDKNKVIADLEENAYGEGFLDDVRAGLVKYNQRKKTTPISEEDWKKQMEDYEKPTENWGMDELDGGAMGGRMTDEKYNAGSDMIRDIRYSNGNEDAIISRYSLGQLKILDEVLRYQLQRTREVETVEILGSILNIVRITIQAKRGNRMRPPRDGSPPPAVAAGAPKAEAKPSPVAAAAAALKPVREELQKGIGNLIYGEETDPRKQKKGLLGISEEGKEESKKKVEENIVKPIMKNIVVPLATGVKDSYDRIFNPGEYEKRFEAETKKRKIKTEQEQGIFRNKEGEIVKKPRGIYKDSNEIIATGKENEPYVRIPNPIKAAELRPSSRELELAGIKLWEPVDEYKAGNMGKTLKQLQDDEFIFVPEADVKKIYSELRGFVEQEKGKELATGFEELGWTKGEMKDFQKLGADFKSFTPQEKRDYLQEKSLMEKQQLKNAAAKVDKDIADEEAKKVRTEIRGERPVQVGSPPDQARLAKMRDAKAKIVKLQESKAKEAQRQFKMDADAMEIEKQQRDREYYEKLNANAQVGQEAQQQSDDMEAFKALSPAERSSQLEAYKKELEQSGYSEEQIQEAIGAVGGGFMDWLRGVFSKKQPENPDAFRTNPKSDAQKRQEERVRKNRQEQDRRNESIRGGAKPVQMKQDDYYKEHQNIVKLLKNTGKSLLSEAKDQQEEASAMAKKMKAPDPFDARGASISLDDDELVGEGAVEFALQTAARSLFNPTGNMTMAGKQTFTPDYDAYGDTIEDGRENAFELARSMYNQQEAIEIPGFDMIQDDTSLRFYIKDDEDVVMVGIRGTDVKSYTDLYTWAVIGAKQDFRMTTRFQDDLQKLLLFQKEYPISQFYYVGTGSSLAGSICDRFLDMGLLNEALTYNPSIEKKYILDGDIHNHRVYLDTDPLFMLMGQFAPNTEIRVNASKANFYNPIKEKDFLIKSHSIYPVYNPAFEGGGMMGAGKTYTLEEWKRIFDAKLEQKRQQIEARAAKKKETAKAKRARAKVRRDEMAEIPELEAPFRTSRVIKATPPQAPKKPRKPRLKIVAAPASARVELREELVAEQPRNPAGEFAGVVEWMAEAKELIDKFAEDAIKDMYYEQLPDFMKGMISKEKVYKDKFLTLPKKKQDEMRGQMRKKVMARLILEKSGRGMKGGARPRKAGDRPNISTLVHLRAKWDGDFDFGEDQAAIDAHAATVPVPDVAALEADASIGVGDAEQGKIMMRQLKQRLPGQIRSDMYFDDDAGGNDWAGFANYHYQQLQLLRYLEQKYPENPFKVMDIHQNWSQQARDAGKYGPENFNY